MRDAILVTGATGFIGRRVVAALRRTGARVLTHSTEDGDIASDPIDVEGVERVIHLAGKSFVPESWAAPRDFYRVNVLGTVNVLEFCRRRGVAITFVSSYVYGVPDSLPIAEDQPVRPLNPYSQSKIFAEETVRYFGSQFGIPTVIVRPFNAYGAGQDERFLIPTLVRQALDPQAREITVRDPRPRRDFVHVDDLVSLIEATVSPAVSGVYNAGSGESVSIGQLVDEINAIVPAPKPVRATGETRPEEVLDVVADISRARRELGWTPRVALRDGLRETVRWMQAHTMPVA